MAINHGSLSARLTPKKTLKGTVQTATIAYESDYERLTNKPSINNIEVIGDLSLDDLGIVNNVQPDWNQHDTEAEDYIKNKPEIPDAQIQSDWEQTDEEAKDYIKNKPEIPSAQVQSDWNEADNTKPDFIKNKPDIPPEQVNSDWNAVDGKAQILNKPTIPSVIANPGNTTENLTSIGINGTNYAIQGGGGGGAVNDVKVNETSVVDSQGVANIDLTGYATTSDIPTDLADLQDDSTHRLVTDTEKAGWDAKADTSDIPTVNNNTITIQKNGQNVDTFTLNQNTDKTIDISVPTKTSDLQNDSSFITNTVSNLANYYLKSETYTKTEVSNLIDAAVNGRFEKVQTLPVTGEANVIYLVPKTTALTNNVYDEYIWQDNAWEQLGSTEIDLSGYVTDTDLTTALADYVTTSAFNTAIANYYTKTEVGNLLDDKVDKVSGKGLSTNDYDNTAKGIVDGVTVALADKVDKVVGKGLSTNDYTTTEKNKVATIDNKADKVSSATNGNLAGLNGEGNPTDSGWNGGKTTTNASGNPISISGLKSNQLAINPVITFDPIQAGSGTPSPSNIRAISGYDKVEALSCGVNVWDEVWELGELNAQGQNASSTTKIRSKNYIPVVGGSTYYLKLSSASAQVFICFYDVNKTFISSNTPYQGTFTVPLRARYCRFNCPATYGTTYNNDMGINYPATQTSYVASNKITSISESLRRMVYGFTLDLRTGKAIVNKPKSITVDSLTWTYSSGSGRFWSNVIADADLSGQYTTNELLCSRLPTLNTYGTAERGICLHTDGRFYIYDPNITDTTALNSTYGNAEIVYTVASPIEIQIPPHEIGLLKDYVNVSTNGTNITFYYHNGELASLADVDQVAETVNKLGMYESVEPGKVFCTRKYHFTANSEAFSINISEFSSLPSNAILIGATLIQETVSSTNGYCIINSAGGTIVCINMTPNKTYGLRLLYIMSELF